MNDAEYARCEAVMASVHGLHNWRYYLTAAGVLRREWCVELRYRGDLATFDADELTRLVKAAHREYVRVSVSARCKGILTIYLHPRKAEGSSWERHPGMEALT